jgi:hypothetical protein
VRARGGRAADQQRDVQPQPLHFLGEMHHLVERGRDQAGQADQVGVVLARRVEDLLRRHHHAEVDDLEVVALEHHADDVLADVVHVALDRGHDDLAERARRVAGLLLGLDERLEVSDRLLHDARRLHHLRQEHLAGAKQVADHVHAVHQRAFDHAEHALATGDVFAPHLLGVGLDERVDTLDQRVLEPFHRRRVAPGDVVLGLLRAAALVRLRDLDQPLGGIGTAVQDHVLDALAQLRLDVLVHRQSAGVDDAHVHAGLARVVQEHGVDRLADRIVAAE